MSANRNFMPLEKALAIRAMRDKPQRVIAEAVGVSNRGAYLIAKMTDAEWAAYLAARDADARPVDLAHKKRHAARMAHVPDLSNPIYNDQAAARAHIMQRLWPPDGKPRCPRCSSLWVRLDGRRHRGGYFECGNCEKKFSVTSALSIHHAKLPLYVYLRLERIAQDGVLSMRQAGDVAGCGWKTAWDVTHRIKQNGGKLV